MNLASLNLVPSVLLVDRKQVRRPRSKRRRIRQKWAKRPENWKVTPSKTVLMGRGMILAHPIMIEQIRRIARC